MWQEMSRRQNVEVTFVYSLRLVIVKVARGGEVTYTKSLESVF